MATAGSSIPLYIHLYDGLPEAVAESAPFSVLSDLWNRCGSALALNFLESRSHLGISALPVKMLSVARAILGGQLCWIFVVELTSQ
jgi:hypothetical protein